MTLLADMSVALAKAVSGEERAIAQQILNIIGRIEGMMDTFDMMYDELDEARKALEEAFEGMFTGKAPIMQITPDYSGDPASVLAEIRALSRKTYGGVERDLLHAARQIDSGLERVDPSENWVGEDDSEWWENEDDEARIEHLWRDSGFSADSDTHENLARAVGSMESLTQTISRIYYQAGWELELNEQAHWWAQEGMSQKEIDRRLKEEFEERERVHDDARRELGDIKQELYGHFRAHVRAMKRDHMLDDEELELALGRYPLDSIDAIGEQDFEDTASYLREAGHDALADQLLRLRRPVEDGVED